MKNSLNIAAALLSSSLPILAVTLLNILIYNEISNVLGISIIVTLSTTALWLSIVIFKKIKKIGIINFATAIHATPDLDNH